MKWSCMSLKGHGEGEIITSAINAHVYIEILDNSFIPLIKNYFSEDEIIFSEQ